RAILRPRLSLTHASLLVRRRPKARPERISREPSPPHRARLNVLSAMKLCLALFFCLGSVLAQEQAAQAPKLPDLPDSAVIAVFDDGTQFTMGEFRKVLI